MGSSREKVDEALKVLDPRSAEIIRLRFGIGCDKPHTLDEIGRAMGLSRERIRQIEAVALRKIQSAREFYGPAGIRRLIPQRPYRLPACRARSPAAEARDLCRNGASGAPAG